MVQRCELCVLPTTMPNIAFDADGVCNYCRNSVKFEFKGEDELKKILAAYRRPDEKYECIVSLSGGRDSTYTLLKLAKDYGMRVLAVNYQNPFTDPQAAANIDQAVKILGVDLVQFGQKDRIHEKTMRHNLEVWLRDPNPALIPMLCIACKTYYYRILKIAQENNIHCIVSGGDPYEDSSFKKELLNVKSDENIETSFMKSLAGVLRQTLKNPGYYHPVCIPTMVVGSLFADPYTLGSRIIGRKITRIDLFHYIEWDEHEILSRISRELNWKAPSHLPSTWRFDCRVGHLKDYLYLATIGMTERDDHFAKMIRQGLVSRDVALERLEKENQIHYQEIEDLLRQVDFGDTSRLYEILSRTGPVQP